MTYEESLRANQRIAAQVINELFEGIALKDWDTCSDLCWELTDAVAEMSESVRNLRIARDRTPPQEG